MEQSIEHRPVDTYLKSPYNDREKAVHQALKYSRQEGSYSMIAENDEKKRSKLWRIAMTVSSILIIIIVIFFGIKLFTSNPLEGKWVNEGSGMVMRIQGNGSASIEWTEESETDSMAELQYSVDLKSKTITLYQDEGKENVQESYDTLAESGFAADTMEGTYDYSLEQGELTLTEREYGDQMVFEKE